MSDSTTAQRWAVTASSPRLLMAWLLALMLTGSSTLGAAIFVVTRSDDQRDTSPGDGACIAQNGGGCSLRAAVQEANALSGSDSIDLPPGTYTLTLAGAGEDSAATGDLDVTSAINLVGWGWSVTTIAMSSFQDRIFDIQGFSSLLVADVTLSGGAIAGVGGGVQVRPGGGLVVHRSRIRQCSAHHGGAIGTHGGIVTVEDSELAHNSSTEDPPSWYTRGPAIASFDGANVTVRRSSLHHNTYAGGGMGGIDALDSVLSIESSSIINDAAGGNSVDAEDSEVSIVSSTLERISANGSTPPMVTLSLGCSIVGYCSYYGGHISYQNYGFNVFFDGASCVGGSDVDGEWQLFPLWAPPGKFPTRVPDSYSSALDGGHAFVCTQDDMWSQALRPYDNDGDGIAIVDIGAVEASLIFFDGFNGGGTWNWSLTQN
ncbi:MAG: hypothetical protein ABI689_08845 [Thermoanaerobaculia bacterium]